MSGALPQLRFQVEERLAQLLAHLGLDQAHFAARLDNDWTGLVLRRPELVASLTLVCPVYMNAAALRPLASRLLVVNDEHPTGRRVTQAMAHLPDATLLTLPDYAGFLWADVMADRPNAIGTALLEFVARMEAERPGQRPVTLPEGAGEVAGLTYHIRGSGPPLVLLPLAFAPSQWAPILPMLSARCCTITLSGAAVGMIAVLEARGRSDYLRAVRTMLEAVPLHPGDRLLEVGCGSGVLSRWLAQHTGRANPIVAVDINPYLLHEAEALATQEGVHDLIAFREGNAEALPFADNSFHVTIACTVLEEGDANQIVAEMVRVTQPGGHVAILVWGNDMPSLVNLEVGSALKAKVEAPLGLHVLARGGCADASLYRRMHDAGLTLRRLCPGLVTFTGPMGYYYLDRLEAGLSEEERHEWRTSMAQAETTGTLFLAQPFHCAVGTKPA
jgi:SAM-dependent methyltransferase